MGLWDRIKQLNAELVALGGGGSSLALPVPTTLLLESQTEAENAVSVYETVIYNNDIKMVSEDLYGSAHYNVAVENCFKLIEKAVQETADKSDMYGVPLMEHVFNVKAPCLVLRQIENRSGKDHQSGYQRIYGGVLLGVRNPCAHEFDWVDDPLEALDLIILAQHLLEKLRKATRTNS
ncbi:TIGR02391 family protein [Acuticoccus sp.]|uniref:TIGR02391 family protein n=1 Tax=Acuticoccus sp. TaxID=1904378 RepID=UPI003B51AD86